MLGSPGRPPALGRPGRPPGGRFVLQGTVSGGSVLEGGVFRSSTEPVRPV